MGCRPFTCAQQLGTAAPPTTCQSRSPLFILQSFMWAERLKERGTGNSARQAAAAGEAKMALEPDVDVAAVFLARQSEAC